MCYKSFAERCGLWDYMSGSSSMALCTCNAHITVYDITTWSWVNLVNPNSQGPPTRQSYILWTKNCLNCQKLSPYKVKGAFSTPVCARKETNGPPVNDPDFPTGSCNRHHALSRRAVDPPTSPCPTLSASTEPIFKTDCAN